MRILAIYGSPRKKGNSAKMLNAALSEFPAEAEIHKVYLTDKNISPCCAERNCLELGYCDVEDDMQRIYNELFWSEIIIYATSSQFGDVTADLKAFMERTWPIRGKLKNKVGGYVVSARRYAESTMNTLHAFMLRHKMILGNSGAIAYTVTEEGGLGNDSLAIKDSHKTGKRLVELYNLIHSSN